MLCRPSKLISENAGNTIGRDIMGFLASIIMNSWSSGHRPSRPGAASRENCLRSVEEIILDALSALRLGEGLLP